MNNWHIFKEAGNYTKDIITVEISFYLVDCLDFVIL